ncbi:hypothetical protein D3C72_535060 [compost metagenome]
MAKGIPFGRHGYDKSVEVMVLEAAIWLQQRKPAGFTERDVCEYLDERYPRKDDRPWKSNMTLCGDYAIWADNEEICCPSATEAQPKFLERISARNEWVRRYRMRQGWYQAS